VKREKQKEESSYDTSRGAVTAGSRASERPCEEALASWMSWQSLPYIL